MGSTVPDEQTDATCRSLNHRTWAPAHLMLHVQYSTGVMLVWQALHEADTVAWKQFTPLRREARFRRCQSAPQRFIRTNPKFSILLCNPTAMFVHFSSHSSPRLNAPTKFLLGFILLPLQIICYPKRSVQIPPKHLYTAHISHMDI